MTAIIHVHGRQILDSRGNPTVEVEVLLEDGSFGRAAVPSGASTGAHEAVEKRDGDKSRWLGKGVEPGGRGGATARSPQAVLGMEAEDQAEIDARDDRARRHRRTRRGSAPTRSSASASPSPRRPPTRAACRSTAMSAASRRSTLPVPMMNILNGGAHADNPIDFQEFMVMPVGAPSFAEALRCGAEIFHTLKKGLHDAGLVDRGRRRRRLRAQPRLGPRRARLHHDARSSRPATRPATTSCSRSIARRPNSSGTAPTGWRGRGGPSRPPEMADYLAELCRRLSDRLDRGRHGRGRSRRLEGADRRGSATGSSWSATICSSPIRSGSRMGIERRPRQFDPDQGQPDRHPDRDARGGRRSRTAPATPR